MKIYFKEDTNMNKMMENEFVKQVMGVLDNKKLELIQFRSCNAYYGLDPIEIEWCDGVTCITHTSRVIPIVSYKTVVGFADVGTKMVFEYGKYSRTTSKQFTQICNYRFPTFDRVLVDVSTSGRW